MKYFKPSKKHLSLFIENIHTMIGGVILCSIFLLLGGGTKHWFIAVLIAIGVPFSFLVPPLLLYVEYLWYGKNKEIVIDDKIIAIKEEATPNQCFPFEAIERVTFFSGKQRVAPRLDLFGKFNFVIIHFNNKTKLIVTCLDNENLEQVFEANENILLHKKRAFLPSIVICSYLEELF